MTPRFGIDTSVLVRLLTGEPEPIYAQCVAALTTLIEDEGAEVVASNQVIGEAYVAVQHHYGVSKPEARAGLLSVLRSGLVSPQHGQFVLEILQAEGGCGLLDRLIVEGYERAGLFTLTLDERMSALPGAKRLR